MDNKNYYGVLGLNETATENEIKKAYRKFAKQTHPDSNPDDPKAEEKFKLINEAYGVLSDKQKRSTYDNGGDHRFSSNQFSSNFKYQRQSPIGEILNLVVKLTLEEIFTGVTKEYKYKRNEKCGSCLGHGGYDSVNCGMCGGNGVVIQQINTFIGVVMNKTICPTCSGSGVQFTTPCKPCNSSGLTVKEINVDIPIPVGIDNTMVIVIGGKGNAIKGGEYGDLHIKIVELKHDTFVRSGNDLNFNLKLTYPQLVLGDKVVIPTIDSDIRITISEFSDVGTNLRIKNKGLKRHGDGVRGDMTITLDIEIPKILTDEVKELINKLKEKL